MPGWLTFTEATMTFTVTGTVDDATPVSGRQVTLTLTATDDHNPANTASVTMTIIVYSAPTCGPNQASTVIEGVHETFDLADLTFDDNDVPSGEVLTYEATGLPSWISFDTGNAGTEFAVNATDGATTPVTVTVTATDEGGRTASCDWVFTVTASTAPTFNPGTVNFVHDGASCGMGVQTVPITLGTGPDDPVAITGANFPAFLTFAAGANQFTVTCSGAAIVSGTYTALVTVFDGFNNVTEEMIFEFTQDVTSVPNSSTYSDLIEDHAYVFNIPADTWTHEDDNEGLTFVAVAGTNNGATVVFDDDAMTITITNHGAGDVIDYEITASDPFGNSAAHNFTFELQQNNPPTNPDTYDD